MTKVPRGFDVSFLNEEEARKILQVLERNEELQRAEKERISKLQKTKRDSRWLQGVTGEWFEEIQRKKFCNEADVSQMLKQPLTYRLRKGMAKNDPVELQTSRCKNLTNQKKPTSVPSRLSFRSSFASLFSFRKSGKETLKLQSLGQKGCDGHVGTPVSVRGTTVQAKLYNSPLDNQAVDSAFVPKPAIMREGSGLVPPWDASVLESEFFQVLDDLDSKLAQEQCGSSASTGTPFTCGSRTPFSHSYFNGNRQGTITGRHKNRYNETSNMSIYDILRPGTPREGFKPFSPRTRTICDMYRTREPRILKEDYMQKKTLGSTSLCFDSRQRMASPATGSFTARSLHFPATTQDKSRFVPPSCQQSPKRTPLSSIVWNRSDSSRDRQTQEEFLQSPSPMDVDPAEQYTYPRCFRENRRHELYHSQNIYPRVSSEAPMDNPMSPDTFENSENMPFYHQDNPFARSFFSNTFRQGREQRFGQSSFRGQQKELSSWSDFHQSRKTFSSSDRDFETISFGANRAASVHGHMVPSQHRGPFSPNYEADVFRGEQEPYLGQSDFQTSPLESMEVSHNLEDQLAPHFGIPGVFSTTSSSYHIKSSGFEYQQDSSAIEGHRNDSYSFRMAQTLASSFKTSFSQTPNIRGNSQSPKFQNSTVTLQKMNPNKPDSFPIRSHTEVTVPNRAPDDSPPLAESQPKKSVTEVTSVTDLNSSILEEEKQRNKMELTNMAHEISQSSQREMSNSLPGFQNSLSQDSAKSNRFGFSASTTVSSKRSPRVPSRKESSQIFISHREKTSELEKKESCLKTPGSATALPFTKEGRASPSFTSQGYHQELTTSNEDTSDTVKNSHVRSAPTGNPNIQTPAEPVTLDIQGQQDPTADSTDCSKLKARHSIPCDSSIQSSGAPPDSSASNNSVFSALMVPSPTVLSGKSPSDKDPSPGEREEKDDTSQNPNKDLAVNFSENQKSTDSPETSQDEVVDVVKCRSYSPFRNAKEKGSIRRHISCIEKLSQMESSSMPTSQGRGLREEHQSNPTTSEFSTIYCTLPRKSASFLINSSQPESKIIAASIRNGPLPFQIRKNVEEPVRKYLSMQSSPGSSESTSPRVVSDSAPVAPEATERKMNIKVIRSASVRKGPLPFFTKRALSCPSGEPGFSTGRDERKKTSVSEVDASAVTPRPCERIVNPLESDSLAGDCPLTKRYHQKELCKERTEKDGEMVAPRTSMLSLSNKDPLPVHEDTAGKESGKALHKFKTTSMFSVSGDDDNVKCLEVVSVYYTLPRKPSKKFCDLLQQYTQNANLLTGSPQMETKTCSNALEKDKPSYSPQEQLGTTSSENLKVPINSAQGCLSHTTEKMTDLKLSIRGPSEAVLQAVASVGIDASVHKGEPKSREVFPDNLAKTPLGDSQSRKERGGKLQSKARHTSLMLQEKKTTEEKSENFQQSINAGNSVLSGLLAHSEDNVENSQTRRSSGEWTCSSIAFTSTGNGKGLQEDYAALSVDDKSGGSQPREVRNVGTSGQKMTEKMLSDSESQAFALTLAFDKLQLAEETHADGTDVESLQSEPRELAQGSQGINTTEGRKVRDEIQKLAWDQTLLPRGNNKNKANLDDLEKGEHRPSVKHKLAAMSKASRKFPAKDVSPRKHVATIFPKNGSKSGFGHWSVSKLDCDPLSPEPAQKSTDSADKSSLSKNGKNVKKSENPLQGTGISNREPSRHSCNQKSNNISQLQPNEFQNVSESLPKHSNSKDKMVAPILEKDSRTAQPTCTNLREAYLSDHQKRLSPPFLLESAQKSPISQSLASCQQQLWRAPSSQWEPGPGLYRSKSLKNINLQGDLLRQSHPPKVRGRHFSESTSMDNDLSPLPLENEFPTNTRYSRRFKSFSELPSSDENESWAVYSSKTKTGPKSASYISRPIDYGIFGKEQQLAFLENVKRSLTQGRLWKPSFLKNPGFLKNDGISPAIPSESLNSASGGRVPEEGLLPSESLNIYEEDPVVSDYDTDTTTDDEYYLDENDKESEL